MVKAAVWPDTVDAATRAALDPGVPDDVDRTPDVLVVGGGVLGLNIAAACTRQGLGRVVLLERDHLASGASGGAAAALSPAAHVWTEPPEFVALGSKSVELYRQLQDAWGETFAFRPMDWLIVLPEGVPDTFTPPQGIERLDPAATTAAEPALTRAPGGALLLSDQAHINPLLLAATLARHTTQVATGVTVTDIETSNDHATRVRTSHGDFEPGAVVYATGVVPERVLPVAQRWVKGHLIATAPAPFTMNKMIAAGEGLFLQLLDGRIVAGGTVEEGDHSPATRSDVTDGIAQALHGLLPATEDLAITHRWCCFRPAAADGLPVIDRAPQIDNVWATAGHFRTGILMGAATGHALAQWVSTGERPSEVATLGLDRFEHTPR